MWSEIPLAPETAVTNPKFCTLMAEMISFLFGGWVLIDDLSSAWKRSIFKGWSSISSDGFFKIFAVLLIGWSATIAVGGRSSPSLREAAGVTLKGRQSGLDQCLFCYAYPDYNLDVRTLPLNWNSNWPYGELCTRTMCHWLRSGGSYGIQYTSPLPLWPS